MVTTTSQQTFRTKKLYGLDLLQDLTEKALDGKVRYNGNTYLSHAKEVQQIATRLVADEFKTIVSAASYSHDLVEDASKDFCVTKNRSEHPKTAKELIRLLKCTKAYSRKEFTKSDCAAVCYLIDRLTNVPTSDISYKNYLAQLHTVIHGNTYQTKLDICSLIIKLADRSSNTVSNEKLDEEKMRRIYNEKLNQIDLNTQQGQDEYLEFLKQHDVIFLTRPAAAKNRTASSTRRTKTGNIDWYEERNSSDDPIKLRRDVDAFIEARREVFEQTKRVNALDNITKFLPEFEKALLDKHKDSGVYDTEKVRQEIHKLYVESFKILERSPDFDMHEVLTYLPSDLSYGTCSVDGKLTVASQIKIRWLAGRHGKTDPSTGERLHTDSWKKYIPAQDTSYFHRLLAPTGVEGSPYTYPALMNFGDTSSEIANITSQHDLLGSVPNVYRYSGESHREFMDKSANHFLSLIPDRYKEVMRPLAYCCNISVDSHNFRRQVATAIEKYHLQAVDNLDPKNFLERYPRRQDEDHLTFTNRIFSWDMGAIDKDIVGVYIAMLRTVRRYYRLQELLKVEKSPSLLVNNAIRNINFLQDEFGQDRVYGYLVSTKLLTITKDISGKKINWYSQDKSRLEFDDDTVRRAVIKLIQAEKKNFIEDTLLNWLPSFDERILCTTPKATVRNGHGIFNFEATWTFDSLFYAQCFESLADKKRGYQSISRVMRSYAHRDRSKKVDKEINIRPPLSVLRRKVKIYEYGLKLNGRRISSRMLPMPHPPTKGQILNEPFKGNVSEWSSGLRAPAYEAHHAGHAV